MNSNLIITIGRQYGSGGREIGEKLAHSLGIGFYNNELITLAAKKSGMAHNVIGEADEKATNSLLYTLAMAPPSSTATREWRSICRSTTSCSSPSPRL